MFLRNHRFMFMEARGSILRRIFDCFLTFFCYKNCLKHASKNVWKNYRFFVVFWSILGPQIDKKGPKKVTFLRLAVRRGVRRHLGTPRERILTLPGGLLETPGRHFGTPRRPSGTILGGLGGFLDHLGLMLGSNLQQMAANSRKQQLIATETSK